jgi:RNA polymerase sigma factor (sigma-70 family)
MSLVIAGEIDKLAILYEKYKMPLYAYFFKLTKGDSQASEDLVHTVFYRVIKYRTTFTERGSFASWLFRIAHNAGIDQNIKLKRINNYKIEANANPDLIYEQDTLEKDEQHSALQYALGKLKEEEREILILGKIDNLRYKEIAEILGTTESNVKIKIFRALKKLKDIYTKLENKRYEKAGTLGKII